MEIRPSPNQEALIRQAVKAGRFEHPEDAVKAAPLALRRIAGARACRIPGNARRRGSLACTWRGHRNYARIHARATDDIMERTGGPDCGGGKKRPAKWHTASPNAPRRIWKISPITSPRKAAAWKTARRVIESITDRFHLLGAKPPTTPDELETTIWAQAAEAFRPTDISSYTASSGRDVLILRVAHSAGTSRRLFRAIERARGGPQGPPPFAIGAYDNNIWHTEVIMSSNCHCVGKDTHRFSNVTGVAAKRVHLFPVETLVCFTEHEA